MLALCTVKVNDMKTLETESLKLLCLSYRVLVVYFLAVIITFCQTHALAFNKVYGRDEFNHYIYNLQIQINEVLQNLMSYLSALLRVKLHCEEVVLLQRCRVG